MHLTGDYMSDEVIVIETDNPIFVILSEEDITDILFVDGVGPRGDKGDAGEKGDTGEPGADGANGTDGVAGADGKSAYQLAVDTGFIGTESQWLTSLKGDKGDKGDTGAQGIQGIQGIQGPKGDTGDTGPRGIQGEQGLKGDKGDKGDPGDLIRHDPSFTYDTEGNLTNVDYPDGSFKEFTYTAGQLTTITYELGGIAGTRNFVYAGDVLERIED